MSELEPLNQHFDFPEMASAPLPKDVGHFGNTYLRFTILFALLVVSIATLPLWLSPVIPYDIAYINAAITLSFSFVWLVVALNALRNYSKLNSIPMVGWDETFGLRSRKFKHLVIVPCYLDPLDVLHECVDTLTFQQHPQDLIVAITFEAKTPELQRKLDSVRNEYRDKFGDLLLLVHHLQVNEIPGGCSNKNFALREAYKFCSNHHGSRFKMDRYTITTCDTDSKFHPRYFEVLEAAYNAENPFEGVDVKMCVWQPPLFYNWNLDERPFFNRVTCIMRTTMMLGGLISFNLNPMSIFSYPMELGVISGFINPRYGVDDIIAKVRWMAHTNSQVPATVKSQSACCRWWPSPGLPWGSLSGRRHMNGAARSAAGLLGRLNRFTTSSSTGREDPSSVPSPGSSCSLCTTVCCCVLPVSLVSSPRFRFLGFTTPLLTSLALGRIVYAGPLAIAVQLFAFGLAFLIDALGARRLGIVEDINPARNLLHWISSPVVLLVYSLIAFISIVRFIFEGKAMAKHDMAGKNGLKSPTATGGQQPVVEKFHNDRTAMVSGRSVTSSRSHKDGDDKIVINSDA
ncbi:membrane-associated protein, putative [Bodo saltans]|uniref:Membrane-associated protein, putative n=1 Tax=Bodo saltans TaxID=75058 RepID=A0A0S4JRW5_BODSA|nr:membrane-associated protein, putative [Bodo saltans]|eukprot:CUG92130.1 membrane-associated protein, putative [Bodo saltans]